MVEPLSRPCRPFWGPLAAILDFSGSAALQAVSECPLQTLSQISGYFLMAPPLLDSKHTNNFFVFYACSWNIVLSSSFKLVDYEVWDV